MLEIHDRAFKEWAVICEALAEGKQTVLIRKGGIREEDGVFRVEDSEFFLMPTYDHQTPSLLKSEARPGLAKVLDRGFDPNVVKICAYAVVDLVTDVQDESTLRRLDAEHLWNEDYLRMRLDYNPYDPLYVLMLRVLRLPEETVLPMRAEYGGCKSWVTLERPISTRGAVPALSDDEFDRRRRAVQSILSPANV